MEYVRLGATDLTVSRVCLGTMTFGLQCDEVASRAILDEAFAAGITFVDTADVYPIGGDLATVGATEMLLGRWLSRRRHEIVLATKFGGPMGPGTRERGASWSHVPAALDASLRRLGTDRIDLYQLHRPDPSTPIGETLLALADAIDAGKVRYIGCSNFTAEQLEEALTVGSQLGVPTFATTQPRYSLLSRQIEQDLLPACDRLNVGTIVYNPLAGGLLTGKHDRGQVTAGTRFALGAAGGRYRERYWQDSKFDTVETLAEIAAAAGIPLATLALRWVLFRPGVTAAIVGASRSGQLADNMRDLMPLEPSMISALDALTDGYCTDNC